MLNHFERRRGDLILRKRPYNTGILGWGPKIKGGLKFYETGLSQVLQDVNENTEIKTLIPSRDAYPQYRPTIPPCNTCSHHLPTLKAFPWPRIVSHFTIMMLF